MEQELVNATNTLLRGKDRPELSQLIQDIFESCIAQLKFYPVEKTDDPSIFNKTAKVPFKTWLYVNNSITDTLKSEAKKCGNNIARIINMDIVQNMMDCISIANGNRIDRPGISTDVLTEAQTLFRPLSLNPTHLILSPQDYAVLANDKEFKAKVYRERKSQLKGMRKSESELDEWEKRKNELDRDCYAEFFGASKIIRTPFMKSGTAIVFDADMAMTFFDGAIEIIEEGDQVIVCKPYKISIDDQSAILGIIADGK